jgi:hypothetical protein
LHRFFAAHCFFFFVRFTGYGLLNEYIQQLYKPVQKFCSGARPLAGIRFFLIKIFSGQYARSGFNGSNKGLEQLARG